MFSKEIDYEWSSQKIIVAFLSQKKGDSLGLSKSIYSMLQKSIDGHYIRMKWPYFQSLKNLRNTARKVLRLFGLNAKHSEVS